MSQRKTIWLLVIVFLLSILSCTRLESPPKDVQFNTEKLPTLNSIPLEWGKLVSVSTTPIYAGAFLLWFQDENGKIRLVTYSIKDRCLIFDAVVISRK